MFWAAAAAFVLRLVLLVWLPEAPIESDAALYDRVAHGLTGEGNPSGGFYRGFGYPLFLALLYAFGADYYATRVLQAGLWATTIGLIYLLAERSFDRRTAIVSSALVFAALSLLPHFLWTLTENLLALEVVGATAALLLLRGRWRAVTVGLLVGAAALTHPGWQLFVPVGLALLWSRRDFLVGAASALAITLVVVVPMHALFSGPWTYGKGQAGQGGGAAWSFYVGSKPDGPTPEDYEVVQYGYPATPSDSYYWREGLDNFVSWHTPALVLGKAWRLWTTDATTYATGSPTFDDAIDNVSPLVMGAILLLGLIGLARVRSRTALVLAAPALYATVLFAVMTYPESRYVMPAITLAVLAPVAMLREGATTGSLSGSEEMRTSTSCKF